MIALLCLSIVAACRGGATANPMIEAPVRPVGATSISGIASISDVGSGLLGVHVGLEPIDPPPSAAEVRRGGCESTDVVFHLQPLDPRDRFEFVGGLYESLATIRPVSIIVLDMDGEPIGCASFASP